jgi:hypothetical protein
LVFISYARRTLLEWAQALHRVLGSELAFLDSSDTVREAVRRHAEDIVVCAIRNRKPWLENAVWRPGP